MGPPKEPPPHPKPRTLPLRHLLSATPHNSPALVLLLLLFFSFAQLHPSLNPSLYRTLLVSLSLSVFLSPSHIASSLQCLAISPSLSSSFHLSISSPFSVSLAFFLQHLRVIMLADCLIYCFFLPKRASRAMDILIHRQKMYGGQGSSSGLAVTSCV